MGKTFKETQSPIVLSSSDYWMEIEELTKTGKIPRELGGLLKGVINSHMNETIPCTATPRLIKMMKRHLMGGVRLIYSDRDRFYNVMVFVPNAESSEVCRSFFLLVPKYNGGRLKYLDEI
jgi:hypothetical protein